MDITLNEMSLYIFLIKAIDFFLFQVYNDGDKSDVRQKYIRVKLYTVEVHDTAKCR